jgi:acetolactate synthase-1/2/3 large subunit
MRGGDALVETLIACGVDTAFSVPGESYLPILDAIKRNQNAIRLVTPRHEQGVTFAAEAYGKLTGRPAAGFVSRGPGATNASIGVHTAAQDSTPMVLFIGQVPTTTRGREAFQEIDLQMMFGSIAKAVLEPRNAADVARTTAHAVALAKSGRPGPVVVVMPKDITDGDAGNVTARRLDMSAATTPDKHGIETAKALIDAAERPLVISGEMISLEKSHDSIIRFAEASGAAVTAAYRRQDTFPNDHEAYVGHLEINRVSYQARLFEEADLIIAAGTRLDGITTQEFSFLRPHHKLIHIYPDAAPLANMGADLAIDAHCGPTLDAIAPILATPSAARRAWRDTFRDEYDRFARPGNLTIYGATDLSAIVTEVQAQMPDDTVILCDSGTFARWVHRFYRFTKPHTQAGPMSGAMGYAAPGALGAAMALPGAEVIAFVGDGGFLMSGQEIVTAVQHKLPIKIILCDNNAWGSILVSQVRRFGDEGVFGTRIQSPDFKVVAEGYGVPAFRVEKTEEFAHALAAARDVDGPALIHVLLDERDVSPFTDEPSV